MEGKVFCLCFTERRASCVFELSGIYSLSCDMLLDFLHAAQSDLTREVPVESAQRLGHTRCHTGFSTMYWARQKTSY